MTYERITTAPMSEAHWLEMRTADVTSTECAALFSASPYLTAYQLHHRKAGSLAIDDFEENDRMVWGKRLEDAIARGIAEDYGVLIVPFKFYTRIPELRIGSSFDFKIIGLAQKFYGDERVRNMFRDHGEGILEIKNVDGLQFRRGWIEDAEGEVEAPPHIELQVQHQMEVADRGWCVIAPLVGGNTPKLIIRKRDTDIGNMIRERAASFWAGVDAGIAPEPDYVRDASAIAAMYVENDGSVVDMGNDERLNELCRAYKAAAAEKKEAEDRQKAARSEILTIVKAAKTANAADFKVSAGTRKESFRSFDVAAGERVSITISQVPGYHVESTVKAYRDVRITDRAA